MTGIGLTLHDTGQLCDAVKFRVSAYLSIHPMLPRRPLI